MYQLINYSANILIGGIPDLATADYEFTELVALCGDLAGDTIIYDTRTGEVVKIFN